MGTGQSPRFWQKPKRQTTFVVSSTKFAPLRMGAANPSRLQRWEATNGASEERPVESGFINLHRRNPLRFAPAVCEITNLSSTIINNYRNEGRSPEAVSLEAKRLALVKTEVVDPNQRRLSEFLRQIGRKRVLRKIIDIDIREVLGVGIFDAWGEALDRQIAQRDAKRGLDTLI